MKNQKLFLIALVSTAISSGIVVSIAPPADAQFNGSLNGNRIRARVNSPNNNANANSTNNANTLQGNINVSPIVAAPIQVNVGVLGSATGGNQNGSIVSAPGLANINMPTQSNTTNQNTP
jgi:hypothetical protein